MKSKSQDGRVRNFGCMLYLDSAPKNWYDILVELKIPCFISPYHDKDIDPQGQPKKPHYHIMFMFEGKKSTDQIRDVISSFNGVGLEVIQSIRGYARYLCHLDNPEKAQYSVDDVRCLCGSDYSSCISLVTDKYKAIRDIIDYCKENNIYSYSDLLEYTINERGDWFRVLCDNGTYVVKEYLKSRQWTLEHSLSKGVTYDIHTGEVIDMVYPTIDIEEQIKMAESEEN